MQQQAAVVNHGQVNAGYNGQPGPAAVVQMPYGQPLTRTPNVVTNFDHLQSLYLGVAIIVSGALSIIFNIVDLSVGSKKMFDEYNGDYYYYESLGFVGHGFWSGIMCVIAGGLGVGASFSRTVGMIRAFLVLSILAACFCLIRMIIGIGGACRIGEHDCIDGNEYEDGSKTNYNNYANGYHVQSHDSSTKWCTGIRTLITMEALLAILSLVGGVAAIWGSALCCKVACCCGCCCCKNYPPTATNGVAYYNAPNTLVNQQQQQPGVQQAQMMYPGQPQGQGFQYVQPGILGQQFVAGPSSYVVGPPSTNPHYKPPAPLPPTD